MKELALFLFLILTMCQSFGQTQLEMNENAKAKYLNVDKKLNLTYQKILSEYKSDRAFIKNFKAAQRIWVQFRDAEMLAKYPDREPGYYGSIQPLCWYIELTTLTEERLKKINTWLTGIKEGDSCAGSVKTIY